MIEVGVLGATGIVGQQYLKLLQNHPWFKLSFLAASEKSAGKSLKEATDNRLKVSLSEAIENMPVFPAGAIAEAKKRCQFLFSALDTASAMQFEEEYAKNDLPIISNASFHRKSSDVPILIPEINSDHLEILLQQRINRGFNKGFIVVKPNCSIQSYLIPLFAIHEHFPIRQCIVTTMQAISGAGWPGVSALDITGNIIPYIEGEEEKSEREPLKILGKVQGNTIVPNQAITFSAHCNRVPVLDGHMACCTLAFEKNIPTIEDVIELWHTFRSVPQQLNLPSAPKKSIIYQPNADRPQTRLDLDAGLGMSVTVGRLRSCPIMHQRFTSLSHNTIRGAAGGAILNAELLKSLGYL